MAGVGVRLVSKLRSVPPRLVGGGPDLPVPSFSRMIFQCGGGLGGGLVARSDRKCRWWISRAPDERERERSWYIGLRFLEGSLKLLRPRSLLRTMYGARMFKVLSDWNILEMGHRSYTCAAAILKQLVQDRPLIMEPVKQLYHQHADREIKPSLDEMYSVLSPKNSWHKKVS